MKKHPKKIPVNSIFGPTIQGEGPVAGRPTVFVRVFGCDSRCKKCDSMYAVEANHPHAYHQKMTPLEIYTCVKNTSGNRRLPVTFSGGNPALYDLSDVVDLLHIDNTEVWVETQATIYSPWLAKCDQVILSPKGPGMDDARKGTPSMAFLYEYLVHLANDGLRFGAANFKVVCFGEEDLDYVVRLARYFPHQFGCRIYLSVGNAEPESSDHDSVKRTVMQDYKSLCERVASTKGLEFVTVLPQLHVAVYGNKRSV